VFPVKFPAVLLLRRLLYTLKSCGLKEEAVYGLAAFTKKVKIHLWRNEPLIAALPLSKP